MSNALSTDHIRARVDTDAEADALASWCDGYFSGATTMLVNAGILDPDDAAVYVARNVHAMLDDPAIRETVIAVVRGRLKGDLDTNLRKIKVARR